MPGISIGSLWSPTNPTSNVRAENGELWVRAEAGMLGYADEVDGDNPSATAWRPTGDLVEIVGTRVLFRGRQSEIINVGGVKVHPLPVEERILALGSVEAARVFGRPSKLTGAIVAVQIVPAGGTEKADTDEIRRERQGCRGRPAAGLAAAQRDRGRCHGDPGRQDSEGDRACSEAIRASRWSPGAAGGWALASSRPSSTPATASRPAPAPRRTPSGPGRRTPNTKSASTSGDRRG